MKFVFIQFSTFVLLLTSFLKMLSVASGSHSLLAVDPLFGITYASLLVVSAAIEFVLSLYVMLGNNDLTKNLCLLWISGNFMLYHMVRWLLDAPGACPCLGSIGDWIRVDPKLLTNVSLSCAGVMFCGSLAWLESSRRVAMLKFESTARGSI